MLATSKPKPAFIKPVAFYGGSLPRPRVYNGPMRLNTERVDAPHSMNYYLCKWAKDATWQMGGVSDKPKPLQGKIVSSMKLLRKVEARENKKKLREIRKRKEEMRQKEGKFKWEESEIDDSDIEEDKDLYLQLLKENDDDSGAEESDIEAQDEDGDNVEENVEVEDAEDQVDDPVYMKEENKRQRKRGKPDTEAIVEIQPTPRETRGRKHRQSEVVETPVTQKKARLDTMSTGGSEKASSYRRPKTPSKIGTSTERKAKQEKTRRIYDAAMTSRRSLRLTLTPS